MKTVEVKQKYLSKVVQYNGYKMTLFSLGGLTWSSKKLELAEIIERREQQRAALSGKKEEIESDAELKGSGKMLAEDDLDYVAVDGDVAEDLVSDNVGSEPYCMNDDDDDAIAQPKTKKLSVPDKATKVAKFIAAKTKQVKKVAQKTAAITKKLPVKPKIVKLKQKKVSAKAAVKKDGKAKRPAPAAIKAKTVKLTKKLPIRKANKGKRKAA